MEGRMNRIVFVILLVASFPLFAQQVVTGVEEDFYTRKKEVRVTDGIGKGRSKEIAVQNALRDAREKALVRSTTSFRHYLSESKDGEFVSDSVADEVYAKIIDKEKIVSINYIGDEKGEESFRPYHVVVVDSIVTVSFFDLDFFAQEIMKTAEAACIRSMVISGWGQVFNRNYFGGVTMSLVTYGSLGYGLARQNQFEKAKTDYANATSTHDAEQKYRMMREHQEVARTMYVIGAMTWAYSVWDAFEDRERADDLLDNVHEAYFSKSKFKYHRQLSFFQEMMMENMRPTW